MGMILRLFLLLSLTVSVMAQTTPTTQVKTLTDLRALAIPTINNRFTVLMSGRNTTNDGFGGTFYFDSTSMASDDDGTVIAPNASGGRWFREQNTPLQAGWFGMTGVSAVTDTSGLQKALFAATNSNAAANGFSNGKIAKSVIINSGSYLITNATDIIVPAGVTVKGEGSLNTSIRFNGTNGFRSRINPAIQDLQPFIMEDLSIYMPNATSNTHAIHVEGDAGNGIFFQPQLKNLNIRGAGVGIYMKACIFPHAQNVTVRDSILDGWQLDGLNTDVTFESCWGVTSGRYGWNFKGNSGFVSGCAADGNTAGGHLFDNCINGVAHVSSEANSGDSITLRNCEAFTLFNPLVTGSASGRHGIVLDGGISLTVLIPTVSANGNTGGYGVVYTNLATGAYPLYVNFQDGPRVESFGFGKCNDTDRLYNLQNGKAKIDVTDPGVNLALDLTNNFSGTSANHGVQLRASGVYPMGMIDFYENPQLHSGGYSRWRTGRDGGASYNDGIQMDRLGLVSVNKSTGPTNNLDVVGDGSVTGTWNSSNLVNQLDITNGRDIITLRDLLLARNATDTRYGNATIYGSPTYSYGLAVLGDPLLTNTTASILMSPSGGGYPFIIKDSQAGFVDFVLNNITNIEMFGGGGGTVSLFGSVGIENGHTGNPFTSTVQTISGLPPFIVGSTVLNTNLNADLLDGFDSSHFSYRP